MQSPKESIIEALLNTFSGMLIAFTISQTAALIAPFIPGFTWDIGVGSNVIMTIILTFTSIARSFLWRRYFNKRLLNRYKHLNQKRATK